LSELLDAFRAGESVDLIRASVEMVLQPLIDAEATEVIRAAPHERRETRTNQRNGSRPKLLTTKSGDVEVAIPKLRHGSFFPSILERRRRIDRALFAVVMEAYVHGVSTRKVDDLVQALGGAAGISKSEVSRICTGLDESLQAFRDRPLDHVEFPYVFLDATYVKARVGGRIVSKAVIVATGVSRTGDREVLGVEVGNSEDGALWIAFLRGLRARGLSGVKLVISDAHSGLREAISSVMLDTTWQRCKVHLARNVLAKVPKGSADMVAAAMRTIYAQPDADHVGEPPWVDWRLWAALGSVESADWRSCRCRWLMAVLELDGCEHAKRRVPALTVVEDLEVFEDRVRELDAGAPSLPVEQLDLHAAPERLDDGVVEAVADGTHGRQ
jgi:transposase-like protein